MEKRDDTAELVERAARGDQQAWGMLLSQHEGRLRSMIALRLDRRLQSREAVSDVIQESYLEAAAHLDRYRDRPEASFYLWLRGIVGNKMLEAHRRHLQAECRDARREARAAAPETTCAALADFLVGRDETPSQIVRKQERREQLEAALAELPPVDREVLAMRHFEQLSNAEVAEVLGIETAAASKRYLRALKRLRKLLTPGDDSYSTWT